MLALVKRMRVSITDMALGQVRSAQPENNSVKVSRSSAISQCWLLSTFTDITKFLIAESDTRHSGDIIQEKSKVMVA